jgi:hypothetical protein
MTPQGVSDWSRELTGRNHIGEFSQQADELPLKTDVSDFTNQQTIMEGTQNNFVPRRTSFFIQVCKNIKH